jgi:hybrid cluster-associated redox disulfide protein
MVTPLPNSNMTVAEVLEKWPETVTVFQEFKTACVGCVMAPFDTMDDVARIYEMDLSDLIEALDAVVSADGQSEQ